MQFEGSAVRFVVTDHIELAADGIAFKMPKKAQMDLERL
jgi:hypothetical protein